MNIDEIRAYIHVGSGYVEIDRKYLDQYPGICRRTYIRKDEIQVDYIDYTYLECEEFEETFYFSYNSFEDCIVNAEKYLKSPIENWINYNKTYRMWRFEEIEDKIVETSWKRLFYDLYLHQLSFPGNFSLFSIRSIYARSIFAKLINPYDDLHKQNDTIENNVDLINSLGDFYTY